MNLFAGQPRRNRHRGQNYRHGGRGGRGGGEGEMCGESNMETYIIKCEIDTNGNLLHDSGNSNRGSVST